MTIWCQTLLDSIAAGGPGGYVVTFPSYRPDLVEDLARALGCAHVDFRRERMAPLGMAAHRLALDAIEACADERSNGRGVVLQNAEALLAARSEDERKDWLAAFVSAPGARIVVVPLAVFGAHAPEHPHVLRLRPDDIPAESLLMQLASMRIQ